MAQPHRIRFEGDDIVVGPDETVLEALERAGHDVPFACRSGLCRTCLLGAIDTQPPPASQPEFKPSWRELGWFLACSCRPLQSMSVRRVDDPAPWSTVTIDGSWSLADGAIITTRRSPGRTGQWSWLELPSPGEPSPTGRRAWNLGAAFRREAAPAASDPTGSAWWIPRVDRPLEGALSLSFPRGECLGRSDDRPLHLGASDDAVLAAAAVAIEVKEREPDRVITITLAETSPESKQAVTDGLALVDLEARWVGSLADDWPRHHPDLRDRVVLLWAPREALALLKGAAFRAGVALVDLDTTALPSN